MLMGGGGGGGGMMGLRQGIFFDVFWTRFQLFWSQIFARKLFLDARETNFCWTKSFSDSHDFHFFFSTFCWHYFTYLAKSLLLALTLGGIFSKRCS